MNMAFNIKKSPEEILQEEFLQERAAVLGRAGDRLFKILDELRGIENSLDERLKQLAEIERSIPQDCVHLKNLDPFIRQIKSEINLEVNRYNEVVHPEKQDI